MNNIYKTSKNQLAGTSVSEVRKEALSIFNRVKARTKRTPYVRSKYFRKDKIFLNIFWSHIYEKSEKDRVQRLRLYDCALDLIRNSSMNPETRENFQNKDELLHRFFGETRSKEKFVVQIKENKRSKRKDFISVYLQK